MENKDQSILYIQYHVFWLPGDARCEGISSHGIDLVILEYSSFSPSRLNYWSRVTHIHIGKLTIIGSDNGLSPGRRKAII